MTANDLIAAGYRMGAALIHRMIDDLTPAEFHHQPCHGANSAAWIVGHLAVTLRRTAERLGATDLPTVSPELVARLTETKQVAGDQSDLGDAALLVSLFDACTAAVIAAVRTFPSDHLADPPPVFGRLPTSQGEWMLFGGIHIAVHSGQLSTIRRSLGKPPIT